MPSVIWIICTVLALTVMGLGVLALRYRTSELRSARARLAPRRHALSRLHLAATDQLAVTSAREAALTEAFRRERRAALFGDRPIDVLEEVYNVGPGLVSRIRQAGYRHLGDIDARIEAVNGVGPERAQAIRSYCRRKAREAREQADRELREQRDRWPRALRQARRDLPDLRRRAKQARRHLDAVDAVFGACRFRDFLRHLGRLEAWTRQVREQAAALPDPDQPPQPEPAPRPSPEATERALEPGPAPLSAPPVAPSQAPSSRPDRAGEPGGEPPRRAARTAAGPRTTAELRRFVENEPRSATQIAESLRALAAAQAGGPTSLVATLERWSRAELEDLCQQSGLTARGTRRDLARALLATAHDRPVPEPETTEPGEIACLDAARQRLATWPGVRPQMKLSGLVNLLGRHRAEHRLTLTAAEDLAEFLAGHGIALDPDPRRRRHSPGIRARVLLTETRPTRGERPAATRETVAHAASDAPAWEAVDDLLVLAMGAAWADGVVADEEVEVVRRFLETTLGVPNTLRPRVTSRIDALRTSAPSDTAAAAQRVGAREDPIRRRLLADLLFEVAVWDGSLHSDEEAYLARVFDGLDLPRTLLADLQRRWTETVGGAANRTTETPEERRARWLSALDLPADIDLGEAVLRRAYNRIMHTYREDRFEPMSPEFQELAARHRELACEAYEELSALLAPPAASRPGATKEPPPAEAPEAGAETEELRPNAALDAIFG